MSCAACSARVERAVGSLRSVEDCSVNLLTGDLVVTGDATAEEISHAVVGAGYGLIDEKANNDNDKLQKEDNKEIDKAFVRIIPSVVLVVILMYFSMGHMLGIPHHIFIENAPIVNAIIQAVISLAVMFINRDFFVTGFKGALHLAPNMNTLVSMGSLASYFYSVVLTVIMVVEYRSGADVSARLHGLYYESAAMILALISVGKYLEARAKGRTTDALRSLGELRGKHAIREENGAEAEISVDDIRVGDTLIIRPGESIPTDGEVIFGASGIDESMLTGESLPRDAELGDEVLGGTINRSGYIKIKATKTGEGTVLASIINMVKDASATKAPIAKMADRVSAVFVPAVIAIALVTFCGWMIAGRGFAYAIARGISVLVISCPCALGLATPVAIMVGSGVGAKRGILYKTAEALELAGRVKTVIFDKTGTLTKGKPEVTDVIPAEYVSADELLSFAFALERYSEHPLGLAVANYSRDKGLDTLDSEDFTALGGRGVTAKVGGYISYGVSFDYAGELIGHGELPVADYERLSDEGKTPLVFIKGGRYIGLIAVADKIKPDAPMCVSALSDMGICVVMLSGDNERTANAVGGLLGISEVYAGVLPDGKEAVVREFMKGGMVAMVGDGINDAPALTRADLGIAVGNGTDIAIESADVVVMGSDISDIADVIGIGRRTLLNIKENLFWAFIYNSIGIPMAMGILGLSLSPMIGAAMMSLSSFSVVMNSLRLNLYKSRKTATTPTPCGEKCEIFEDIDNTTEKTMSLTEEKTKTEENNMTIVIKVDGMMCPHCEARVKKACEAVEGVISAVASHTEGTVTVKASADVRKELEAAITDAGYDVV